MSARLDDRLRKLIERKPVVPKKKTRRRKPKKRKDNYPIDPTRLEECSESELVHIAQHLGHEEASRAMDRSDLIEVILGEADIEPGSNLLSDIRARIHRYIEGNRRLINVANMPCDLNCPACPHQRVVECYTVNQDLVEE